MKIYFKNLFIIIFLIKIISNIDIKNINENSHLKFPLKQNIYLTASLYLNEKEYNLPIDINSDRTWINNNKNSINNNNIIIEECNLGDIDRKRKKNIPISFFDKNILFEEIAFEEISHNFDNNCITKNGVIGLSKKSEKKILNLLTQLNKIYSIKKYFSIFNNELIIGNFDDELKQNKYISADLVDSGYKWAFNLQGLYLAEINYDYKNNEEYFVINVLNNNYKKLNTLIQINSLQKYIIVYYYYFSFIYEQIFKDKCTIKKNENFFGIYCNKNIIDKLPDYLSFMINDKLLPVRIKSLFIQDGTSNEYLFAVVYSDDVWNSGCILGNFFYNEGGNKLIFDVENNQVHFLSYKIIENTKIIDDYSIDEKQIILNNYSFSKYDVVLCVILFLNFCGIFILLGSLYKEKVINQLPNHIKKIKRMNN